MSEEKRTDDLQQGDSTFPRPNVGSNLVTADNLGVTIHRDSMPWLSKKYPIAFHNPKKPGSKYVHLGRAKPVGVADISAVVTNLKTGLKLTSAAPEESNYFKFYHNGTTGNAASVSYEVSLDKMFPEHVLPKGFKSTIVVDYSGDNYEADFRFFRFMLKKFYAVMQILSALDRESVYEELPFEYDPDDGNNISLLIQSKRYVPTYVLEEVSHYVPEDDTFNSMGHFYTKSGSLSSDITAASKRFSDLLYIFLLAKLYLAEVDAAQEIPVPFAYFLMPYAENLWKFSWNSTAHD